MPKSHSRRVARALTVDTGRCLDGDQCPGGRLPEGRRGAAQRRRRRAARGARLVREVAGMTPMKTAIAMVLAATVAATALAGAEAKFKTTWKAPGVTGLAAHGQKIVGLVISDDMSLRMSTEEALARALTTKGVQGVAAYRMIPAEEIRDKDRARGWFERTGATGVVIMRLVDVAAEKEPSVVVWESGAQYGSLWSYYPYAWGASFNLGPARTNVTLVVETLAFEVANARLLWGGTSVSVNPASAQALVATIVDAAAKQ